MADAIRAADQGAGVLRLYGNYGGDIMNFDMAGDLVEFEDIRCTTVILADDIASAPPAEAATRRGVAGMVYAFKIAGAAAEEGRDLDAVTAVAQKAADACRSVGAALSPCTVPQAGRPTFQIGEDEMEMGMGIHGEPGVWRDKLRPADAIAGEMMDRLLADMPLAKGDRVSVMVNSLGATPPEELYILYRVVKARLEATGASIVMPLVGRYATSMEMAGVSFTLCKLDAELEALLKAPCDCAFWSVR
jgi:dihydroxyacetone kinase-like protein